MTALGLVIDKLLRRADAVVFLYVANIVGRLRDQRVNDVQHWDPRRLRLFNRRNQVGVGLRRQQHRGEALVGQIFRDESCPIWSPSFAAA